MYLTPSCNALNSGATYTSSRRNSNVSVDAKRIVVAIMLLGEFLPDLNRLDLHTFSSNFDFLEGWLRHGKG